MLVVTTENIVGHRVKEVKGQVFGVVVRSRGLAGNIMAGLRSIVGGEIVVHQPSRRGAPPCRGPDGQERARDGG